MKCIYTFTDKTNGKKTSCSRSVFGSCKLCVFHSPNVKGKASAFQSALAELLGNAFADHADLDFKGFIFPRADFQGYSFWGVADFRAANFSEDVDFRGATFHQQADFHTTEFSGNI